MTSSDTPRKGIVPLSAGNAPELRSTPSIAPYPHARQGVRTPPARRATADGHRSVVRPHRGQVTFTLFVPRFRVHLRHRLDRSATARLGATCRRSPQTSQTTVSFRPRTYFNGGMKARVFSLW